MKCEYCDRVCGKDTWHMHHVKDAESGLMIWICDICEGKINVKQKETKAICIKDKIK